jgi:hypothetical protein
MNSKISSEVKGAKDLTGETDAASSDAQTRLAALATRYHVDLGFDASKVITGLNRLLLAIAAEAQTKDTAHSGGLGDHKGLVTDRKLQTTQVTGLLRSGKRNFAKRYTAARAAEVFTHAEPPADHAKLADYADEVVGKLPSRSTGWTAQPGTMALDVAAYVADLKALATALRASNDAIHKVEGLHSSSLVNRNEAEDDLHNGLKATNLVASGLLEFGGNHARADLLRTKHHVGHSPPAPAEQPATVSDPNKKPNS